MDERYPDGTWHHPESRIYEDVINAAQFEALEDTYHMLDELRTALIEDAGELDPRDEIDRNLTKRLIELLEAVDTVETAMREVLDPRD